MTVEFDQSEWSRTVPEWRGYVAALFGDWVWWRNRQLTTGAERIPDSCRCRWELVESGSQYGTVRVRDPRCVIHRPEYLELRSRPVETRNRPPACVCRYGLRPVAGVAGTHPQDPSRHGWRRGVYAFRIDPRCVHHGDGSAVERTGWRADYVIVDEWPAWETLDDAERRGE